MKTSKFFSNKVICITGGAGFIGSHLVERLSNYNCKIIIIDNLSSGRLSNIKEFINNKKNIFFYKKDLNSIKNLNIIVKEVDYFFHLAALADIVPSIQNPQKYFKANVTATLRILENLNTQKIKKFIYLASSTCYGIPSSYPTNEESKIDTKYPYALTKYMGEQLVMHWAKIYKLKAISLRLFNVFGTRSRTSGTYGAVFGVFLAQKISGKPLTVVGNGKQKRDFTYVSDVVDAILMAAMSKYSNEIINIASGKPRTINEIVRLLKHKYVNIPKRPGEPNITWADIKKAKNILRWNPKTSFEYGVKELLNKINFWKKAVVWTPKKIEFATKEWFKYLK
jgi:UDP-glucose 4-epimerase